MIYNNPFTADLLPARYQTAHFILSAVVLIILRNRLARFFAGDSEDERPELS